MSPAIGIKCSPCGSPSTTSNSTPPVLITSLTLPIVEPCLQFNRASLEAPNRKTHPYRGNAFRFRKSKFVTYQRLCRFDTVVTRKLQHHPIVLKPIILQLELLTFPPWPTPTSSEMLSNRSGKSVKTSATNSPFRPLVLTARATIIKSSRFSSLGGFIPQFRA